jgi:tRNA (guanine-N7-)-methyltransferase
LIGCEPFEDGVVKVLGILETEGVTNVRIHPDDGRPLLRLMPESSIDRAFILFPDPWPKRRHHKRRLVSADAVTELARVMRAGSELRIATDVAEYACAILRTMVNQTDFDWTARCADDWRARPPDWPPTRYEAKAVRESRKCYYFRFRRT